MALPDDCDCTQIRGLMTVIALGWLSHRGDPLTVTTGVKIGPAHRPMMPMRHVPFSNTLVARSGPFETVALPALRETWRRYDGCKRDATCRPSLCAPHHITDSRWLASGLAKAYVGSAHAVQWRVPAEPVLATAPETTLAADDGHATLLDGWRAVQAECGSSNARDDARFVACCRSKWSSHLKAALSLKQRLIMANSSRVGGGGGRAMSSEGEGGGSSKRTGGSRASKQSKRVTAAVTADAGWRLPNTKLVVKDGLQHVAWEELI